MKYRELVRLFRNNGWHLQREGRSHEIWSDGENTEQIPRHSEINERLARGLIDKWGLK
ncbi:MAG: type II toxin-antitoxin system HicA family toxin [Coriobacteriales bacterium]|nr:type II toxin-antitoxin system HicA family toxin [Coriobacteriales bacterium]